METPSDSRLSKAPVDVIILNWNGRRLLEEFLPSVVANSDPAISRIVVADNGSDDDSVAFVRANFPDIAVWEFDRNYGFAEGYNKALAMTEAPYAVLLNSDLAPAKGWDTALYEFMEANPGVGAAQPKIKAYKTPSRFEYAGAAGGFLDCNGYPYCRGRIFSECEEDGGQYDTPIKVHWASGAALMVRPELYRAVGGLDADFFAHMEEIDLCWRMRLAGAELMAVPTSEVYHLGGGSLPAENPRKTYLNFRNNLLMLHKNLPDGVRGPFLFRRRLLDTIAWAKYLAGFDFKNASAIIRAHRDFARMRKKYTTHPKENLIGADSASRVNILVDFYLRGRKRFSDLNLK